MPNMDEDEMDDTYIDVMDVYHHHQHPSPSSSPSSSLNKLGCASERLADTIPAQEPGPDNKVGELDPAVNHSKLLAQKVTKDERHTPKWDRKVQREFEAKNPGPPKKRPKREKACIIISDDETDEDLQQIGDDRSIDLWDELVKAKPEHWDIRDASKHGKMKAKAIQSGTKYSSNGKKAQTKRRPDLKNLKSNLQIAINKFSSMHENGKDAI